MFDTHAAAFDERRTYRVVTRTPEETQRLGERLGRLLLPGDSVWLRGDLGAGKSVLARGIIAALDTARWRGSPTFALINEYGPGPVAVHVDLYRLTEQEAADLFLDEYVDRGSILVVEWPERAESHLSEIAVRPPIEVDLAHSGEGERDIVVQTDRELDPGVQA